MKRLLLRISLTLGLLAGLSLSGCILYAADDFPPVQGAQSAGAPSPRLTGTLRDTDRPVRTTPGWHPEWQR